MSQTYWRDATADEAMQDEHAFVWTAMLDTIEIDLAGKRVLGVGCNRGLGRRPPPPPYSPWPRA